jgi:hypothetical protein
MAYPQIREFVFLSITGALLTLAPSSALARFDHTDEDLIDSEERLSREAILDFVNYRPRPSWREVWDTGTNGFRLSAGSLSMTRFLYDEDIRLSSPLEGPLTLALTQRRVQSTVESRREQDLRAQYNFLPTPTSRTPHVTFLGDCDTWKEHGDLGAAAGFHDLEGNTAEVYAWTIDHYYNTKGPLDRKYSKPAQAFGFRGREALLLHPLRLEWAVSLEPTLAIEDSTRQTLYEHAAREGLWSLKVPVNDSWSLRWDARHEWKSERRDHLSTTSSAPHKSLARETHTDDIALIDPTRDLEFGVLHTLRMARYDQSGWRKPYQPVYEEKDHSLRRQELALYGFWDVAGEGREGARWRTGLMGSMGTLEREGHKTLALRHAKLHTGWGYQRDHASLSVATSWDVDMFAERCLQGEECRLWDGGNLQFLVTL